MGSLVASREEERGVEGALGGGRREKSPPWGKLSPLPAHSLPPNAIRCAVVVVYYSSRWEGGAEGSFGRGRGIPIVVVEAGEE